MLKPDRAHVPLLFLVFFLSGTGALLFETVWFRLAGLGLGSTVWTSSIVLTAFMAGLGLGNLIAASRGGSLRRPLRAYAVLELVVGGSGLAVVALLLRSARALHPLLGSFADVPLTLHLLRLGVAFALMLVPAVAMGLTLPLLVRTLLRSDDSYGRVLGRLYGWNTLGGVAGALAGEWWLIPGLGLFGAGLAAATLHATAGAAALFLARHEGELSPTPPGGPTQGEGRARPRLDWQARRLLLAAALAGGLLLALEVIWFRFLQLYVQGTALAFAAMLATILLGIGLGGVAAGRLSAGGASAVWPAAVACWAGTATGYLYAVFDPTVRGNDNFLNDLPAILWLSCRLMFPTALASGMLFTFIGRALHDACPDPARATGLLALLNTAGAALGAVVAGFVLLPRLGVERSIFVLSLGYAAVAALSRPPLARHRPFYALGASVLLFALMLAFFPFGLLRNHFALITLRHFRCTGAAATALVEGVNETILLLRFDWGGRLFAHRLVTNGMSMSDTGLGGRRYMKLFALWPFAVKADIERALLISYGVGNTAVALQSQAGLRSVDVVDVSREILDLADAIYSPPRVSPLRDPRFRVHVEDGRFFLQTTSASFDLITGEPPPPKIAGVANLYSREFFELVFERLSQGGIATYWLPIHDLTELDTRSILAAFCGVFSNCSLWHGSGDDWIMVGIRGSLPRRELDGFTALWSDPRVGAQLVDIGVESPEQLGALFIADAPSLRSWIGGAPPLEDDRPGRLSRFAPRPEDLSRMRALADAAVTQQAFARSDLIRELWPEELRRSTEGFFWVQQALNDQRGRSSAPLSDLHRVLMTTELRVTPLILLGVEARYDEIAREGLAAGDSEVGLVYQLGLSALSTRQYDRAAQMFASVGDDPSRRLAPLYRAFALLCAGRKADARAALRSLKPAALAAAPRESIEWLQGQVAEVDWAGSSPRADRAPPMKR
jgi:predicted membrane-bound spermidine synthase